MNKTVSIRDFLPVNYPTGDVKGMSPECPECEDDIDILPDEDNGIIALAAAKRHRSQDEG